MTITFACGHRVTLDASADNPPQCSCGERRVARVQAPAPRFRGACRGPVATFEATSGAVIDAAPGGALVLKE
jgi:hypothetical protein